MITSTAIVRAPSPALGDAELTFLDRTRIDVDLAVAQHRRYVELLQSAGRRIVWLPDTPALPDGTFVEDTVVVVDDLAVLTRPGAASRRPEVATMATAVADLGLRSVRIEAPGTLDGGDVLQVGELVFVGHSSRTNPAGVDQLRAHLVPLGRTVIAVPVAGCLHLKTGATALPDGRTVLAVTDWLDTAPFRAAGLEVVEAPEAAGADLLVLDVRTVMCSAAAPSTVTLLGRLEVQALPVDISELEKAEAGPTCLSVLIG